MEKLALLSSDPDTQDFLGLFFPEIDPLKYEIIFNVPSFNNWLLTDKNTINPNDNIEVNVKLTKLVFDSIVSLPDKKYTTRGFNVFCENNRYKYGLKMKSKNLKLERDCYSGNGMSFKKSSGTLTTADINLLRSVFSDMRNRFGESDHNVYITFNNIGVEKISLVVNNSIKINISVNEVVFIFNDIIHSKKFIINSKLRYHIDKIVTQCLINSSYIKNLVIKDMLQRNLNQLKLTFTEDNPYMNRIKKRFDKTAEVYDATKDPPAYDAPGPSQMVPKN